MPRGDEPILDGQRRTQDRGRTVERCARRPAAAQGHDAARRDKRRLVPLTAKSLPPSATIRDAVALIEESRRGIATVTDGAGALLGTITDGDVRRLILRGGGLDSRVVEAMNSAPLTARADTSDR